MFKFDPLAKIRKWLTTSKDVSTEGKWFADAVAVKDLNEKKTGYIDTSKTPTVIYDSIPSTVDGNFTNAWTATEDCFLYCNLINATGGGYGLGIKIDGIEVMWGACDSVYNISNILPIKKGQIVAVRNAADRSGKQYKITKLASM